MKLKIPIRCAFSERAKTSFKPGKDKQGGETANRLGHIVAERTTNYSILWDGLKTPTSYAKSYIDQII